MFCFYCQCNRGCTCRHSGWYSTWKIREHFKGMNISIYLLSSIKLQRSIKLYIELSGLVNDSLPSRANVKPTGMYMNLLNESPAPWLQTLPNWRPHRYLLTSPMWALLSKNQVWDVLAVFVFFIFFLDIWLRFLLKCNFSVLRLYLPLSLSCHWETSDNPGSSEVRVCSTYTVMERCFVYHTLGV